MLNWLIGVIIFWAGVYAIYRIWTTNEEIGPKILWTAIVAFLPVLGFIAWYVWGPK